MPFSFYVIVRDRGGWAKVTIVPKDGKTTKVTVETVLKQGGFPTDRLTLPGLDIKVGHRDEVTIL